MNWKVFTVGTFCHSSLLFSAFSFFFLSVDYFVVFKPNQYDCMLPPHRLQIISVSPGDFFRQFLHSLVADALIIMTYVCQ